MIRWKGETDNWVAAGPGGTRHLILVNEFAETHTSGSLTRSEMQSICDEHKTREGFLKAVDFRQR